MRLSDVTEFTGLLNFEFKLHCCGSETEWIRIDFALLWSVDTDPYWERGSVSRI